MTDASRRWRRAGIVLVLVTAYVLLASVAVRVVYLTTYDELLRGLDALEPARLLRDGGLFAFLVRVLRSGLIERATDRILPSSDRHADPSVEPPDPKRVGLDRGDPGRAGGRGPGA